MGGSVNESFEYSACLLSDPESSRTCLEASPLDACIHFATQLINEGHISLDKVRNVYVLIEGPDSGEPLLYKVRLAVVVTPVTMENKEQ